MRHTFYYLTQESCLNNIFFTKLQNTNTTYKNRIYKIQNTDLKKNFDINTNFFKSKMF